MKVQMRKMEIRYSSFSEQSLDNTGAQIHNVDFRELGITDINIIMNHNKKKILPGMAEKKNKAILIFATGIDPKHNT
jgi:hypothetical protein